MKYIPTTEHSYRYTFPTGPDTSCELEKKINESLKNSGGYASIDSDSESITYFSKKDISKKVQAISKKIEKWIEEIADANYEEEKTKRAEVNEWLKNFTPIPKPHPSKELVNRINSKKRDVERLLNIDILVAYCYMCDCDTLIALHKLIVKESYMDARNAINAMDSSMRDYIPDDVYNIIEYY